MRKFCRYRAWLINEKKIVMVDSIHWNKGYGGAQQIWVDNPEFDPVKHILDREAEDDIPESFFSYINHSMPVHQKTTPHQFILLQGTGIIDESNNEIFEGDVLMKPFHIKHDLPIERVVMWDEKNGCFMLPCVSHQDLESIHLTRETGSKRKIRGTYYELYGTDKFNQDPNQV